MKILVLPGDGIGPEITYATLMVLNHAIQREKININFEIQDVGLKALENHGTTLPDTTWRKAEEADGIILAPLSTYEYPYGCINPSAEFRTKLNLFANFRPCKKIGILKDSKQKMDLVIVRENTEGFYSSRSMYRGCGEFMPDPRTAFAIRKITVDATTSISNAAFALARKRKQHVAVIHKANVLQISDGLFLKTVSEVAKNYPEITVTNMLVDSAAAMIIRDPERFDVILTTNMFGDIISNVASEISGGLGLASSLNASNNIAMAQASHGSAPDIANKNISNPTGLILSSSLLLAWLAEKHQRPDLLRAASRIEAAIEKTLSHKSTLTVDLGGELGTKEFSQAVISNYSSPTQTENKEIV
ncbi:isocitrate/isopropylmalate dehydrogenase family protein [Halomonas sp. KM-1]|uniref:isocitrate/isopropylmalate dehydrogenase family protein n=1 Tax=Halomonas sp. KM-1 TaxID=590061 RepID=UPI00054FF8AF|nr:isocitrate/isopropylmalate family dehydrogenase [Halomonas sp. KM-1]